MPNEKKEQNGGVSTNTNTNTVNNTVIPPHRPHRRVVVGIESFAKGKKGVKRAIQEFKYRKERKHVEKAALLRSYKKVMKREGLQAGTGASRKRKRGNHGADDDDDNDNEADGDNNNNNNIVKKTKLTKSNPFQKSLQQRDERRRETEERQKERIDKERLNRRNLKERKRTAKRLSKRTKKGQPVMKHMIHNLLERLEKK